MTEVKHKIRITIKVKFDVRFIEVPRVKIQEPKTAVIVEVQKEFFSLRTNVNPITPWDLHIEYTADFTSYSIIVPLQFCPACFTPLTNWPTFLPAGFTKQNQIVPSVPLGFCPTCGNIFVARRDIKLLQKKKESSIIIPAGVIVGKR